MEITVVNGYFLLLLLLCICFNCRGCMEDEWFALLQIKDSINSPAGTAFSGWYTQDCCQWEGVECDASTSRVSSLIFQYQRDPSLAENWYPNATLFAQFKDLKELLLPGNKIKGFTSPDELQKLKHLQTLDLQDNSIENASNFCWGKGTLPSLYHIDLSDNQLKGLIPECLCYRLPLKELILSGNNLQGNISSCLSNLTLLETLDLSNNHFSGSFPSFLVQNLTSIESLILSSNQLIGKVSFSIFANLSKLGILDISYNAHLELETEPHTWFPSSNINVLKLAGCNLGKFPRFLSTQNNLTSLDLSDNFLEGNIPSWVMHNTTSELWIRGNNLSGPFPKIFRNISSQLTLLDVSKNSFHGPLPEDIDLIFPELVHLDASGNGFNGAIPPLFSRLKELRVLDLSFNELHGEIPFLMTSNMSSLEKLYLRRNKLTGYALPRNSSLPKLKVLALDQNDLKDSLSTSFSQSPPLTQLRVLILRGNQLEGQIPQQLCQMRRLSLLDLSENKLSGEIPDCIGNITSMTGVEWDANTRYALSYQYVLYFSRLDLSCNRLTGSIPMQITQLKAIYALNMSHNLLTGHIPMSLGNLKELESLDLSHNNIFGELHQGLTALIFLELLNVSFNNLSGVIPRGNQFDTFDSWSYRGNPGL